MFCMIMVSLLYLIGLRIRLVQYVSFAICLAGTAYLIAGIFLPDFNPYSFSDTDTSTLARYREFEIMAQYIRDYTLFGIGIPDAIDGLTHYLGQEVYPNDINVIGVWFEFGLVGVLMLGALFYACCVQNVDRSTAALGLTKAHTLALVGCVIALNGVSSDMFGAVSPLWSLILANTIYNARFAGAQQRGTVIFGTPRRFDTVALIDRSKTSP